MKMVWLPRSKSQFQDLRNRAAIAGKLTFFDRNHAEIVAILSDATKASRIGEPLFNTKKPGGQVRTWVHNFVSVTFVVRRVDRVGWVLRYEPLPASWPHPEAQDDAE